MKDIAEQRVRFVIAASRRDKAMASLCQEFEISRPTGYLWLKRYKEQGIAGLKESSRRLLQRTGSTRAAEVQGALEKAFCECGVPEAMLMDHGTPWCNGQGYRGWTGLTVWLMNQDIQLHFSGLRHPQTQGKVERFHGAMVAALLRRGKPQEQHRQAWLDSFRYEHNYVRPHEALRMQTPSQRWKKSSRVYQAHPAAWSYSSGTEVREVDHSGSIRLEGRRWFLTETLVGQLVGVTAVGDHWFVHYRRTLVAEIDPSQTPSAGVDRDWKTWKSGTKL